MSDRSVFYICLTVCFVVYYGSQFVADMWMRWTRSRNIKAHGWPPVYLDADGDPVHRYQDAAETEPLDEEQRA